MKNAEEPATGAAPTPVPAPGRRPITLTLWFALLNSLAFFSILALISLLLYLGLADQLKNQNHLHLHDEMKLLARLIRTEGGFESVADEANPDEVGAEFVKFYIRLVDRNGRSIVATHGMEKVVPKSFFTTPERDGRPGVDRLRRNAAGSLILASAEWVDLGRRSGEQGILEVALDVTHMQGILDGYLLKIHCGLVLGFLLSAGVSLVIARRGTRPLREMTMMLRRMSVSNLEERISGNGWSRELGELAIAANGMLDRLQDSFQRLYNSASNLSHKMRTPLTIMKGEAEVALSRERTVEELQEVIVSGLEENSRLVRLIDNILFLANAEMGKFHCHFTETDAGGELAKVVDFYSPTAEEKGITLSYRGTARLLVDEALFRKAAAALISNALTYNTAGGTVELVLSQQEGLAGQLAVTDTGCGIELDEQQRVFDRFYRIYATRYLDPHGTGLGLPITKAIMDLHNGMIAVQSSQGGGTTVSLTFPAAAQ